MIEEKTKLSPDLVRKFSCKNYIPLIGLRCTNFSFMDCSGCNKYEAKSTETVFCKDCKYIFDPKISSKQCHHPANVAEKLTFYEIIIEHNVKSPCFKNQNNDCPDFVKKSKKWFQFWK